MKGSLVFVFFPPEAMGQDGVMHTSIQKAPFCRQGDLLIVD